MKSFGLLFLLGCMPLGMVVALDLQCCAIDPEFKTATPTALLHYAVLQKINHCFKEFLQQEIVSSSIQYPGSRGHFCYDYFLTTRMSYDKYKLMKCGLLLKVIDSYPSYFWTPWGKFHFSVSISNPFEIDRDCWQRITNKLLTLMTPHKLIHAYDSCHGGRNAYVKHKELYEINGVDGTMLPAPIKRDPIETPLEVETGDEFEQILTVLDAAFQRDKQP